MNTIAAELRIPSIEPAIDPAEQQTYDQVFKGIIAANAIEHTVPNAPAEMLSAPIAEPRRLIDVPARKYTGRHRQEQLSLYDRALTAYTGVKAALAVRRYNTAEKWDTLSPAKQRIYKAGMFITSAAGLTTLALSVRVTGAAAHEVSSFTDGLAFGGNAHALSVKGLHTAPAHEHLHTVHNDTSTLPADLDEAPSAKAIGEWSPRTGSGSIWNQVEDYADHLGYGKLTEHQKWQLTDKVLHHNDLTWGEARHLSAGYKPDMPSQRTMLDELKDVAAKHTHAADREVIDVDPADDTALPDGGHPGEPQDPATIDANKNGIPDATETAAKNAADTADHKLHGFQKWMDDHTPVWHIPEQFSELGNLDEVFPAWWDRNWPTVFALAGVVVGTRAVENYRQHGDFASYKYRRTASPIATPAPVASPARNDPYGNPNATTVTNGSPVVTEKHPVAKKAAVTGGLMFLRHQWKERRKRRKAEKDAKKAATISS